MVYGITPGATTTEYKVLKYSLISSSAVFVVGFFTALFEWSGQLAGLAAMAVGGMVAMSSILMYTFMRAKIKIKGVEKAQSPRKGI